MNDSSKIQIIRCLHITKKRLTPPYWISVSTLLVSPTKDQERRFHGWLLVLAAKGIPYRYYRQLPFSLFIPVLYSRFAQEEITAFEMEDQAGPAPVMRSRDYSGSVLFFFLLLFWWHSVRFGWLAPFDFLSAILPDPETWPERFGLDVYRTRHLHEWWRCLTSLTIHRDGEHLLGNCVFGLFFCIPLFNRTGPGVGLFLTIGGAVLGNALSVFFRSASILSIGFSTGLFSALGALVYCAIIDRFQPKHTVKFSQTPFEWRKILVPAIAGLALLGLLGSGAGKPRVDTIAHIWGFAGGILLSGACTPIFHFIQKLEKERYNLWQWMIFFAVLLVLAVTWGTVLKE